MVRQIKEEKNTKQLHAEIQIQQDFKYSGMLILNSESERFLLWGLKENNTG